MKPRGHAHLEPIYFLPVHALYTSNPETFFLSDPACFQNLHGPILQATLF